MTFIRHDMGRYNVASPMMSLAVCNIAWPEAMFKRNLTRHKQLHLCHLSQHSHQPLRLEYPKGINRTYGQNPKETASADDSMQQLSSFNADIAAKQIATEDAREVNLAHSPQRQPEAEKQKMQFNKGRTRGLREGRSESISVIRVLEKYFFVLITAYYKTMAGPSSWNRREASGSDKLLSLAYPFNVPEDESNNIHGKRKKGCFSEREGWMNT
ncbi:hypothetical protein Tco_0967969 [Tanacetum coccineum]